jgi:hypothetical protein
VNFLKKREEEIFRKLEIGYLLLYDCMSYVDEEA